MTAYRTATKYALLALAKNRLAMFLLAVLIPLWITIAQHVVTHQQFAFRVSSTHRQLIGGGERITMISGSLLAVSLLVGFMMFSAAHRAGTFDRRLTAAGYSRTPLMAARLTALVLAAIVVSVYATAWMRLYWPIHQPLAMAGGVFTTALTYGALGLFLALFLPGELEGMTALIMINVIDLVPQNPVATGASGGGVLQLLPSYGAMQTCLSAGFTGTLARTPLLFSSAWFAGFTVVALSAFAVRTRVRPQGRVVTDQAK